MTWNRQGKHNSLDETKRIAKQEHPRAMQEEATTASASSVLGAKRVSSVHANRETTNLRLDAARAKRLLYTFMTASEADRLLESHEVKLKYFCDADEMDALDLANLQCKTKDASTQTFPTLFAGLCGLDAGAVEMAQSGAETYIDDPPKERLQEQYEECAKSWREETKAMIEVIESLKLKVGTQTEKVVSIVSKVAETQDNVMAALLRQVRPPGTGSMSEHVHRVEPIDSTPSSRQRPDSRSHKHLQGFDYLSIPEKIYRAEEIERKDAGVNSDKIAYQDKGVDQNHHGTRNDEQRAAHPHQLDAAGCQVETLEACREKKRARPDDTDDLGRKIWLRLRVKRRNL
ncbi:hypothetical protein CBS101457_000978 [Exobasidium rhododendri]|nr:hypothetical protein CBS101457_000978 [Exobasidium rhododendri]